MSCESNAKKYGVVIHSGEELKDKSRGINWSWNQCYYLYKLGIRTIDDIKSFPMEEIEKIEFSKPEIYGRLKDAKRKLESDS